MATTSVPRPQLGSAALALRSGLFLLCAVLLFVVIVAVSATFTGSTLSQTLAELTGQFADAAVCASRAAC